MIRAPNVFFIWVSILRLVSSRTNKKRPKRFERRVQGEKVDLGGEACFMEEMRRRRIFFRQEVLAPFLAKAKEDAHVLSSL